MAESAAHLVDHVFPRVPVRQWVLSLPIRLRFILAYDAELCSKVLNVFIREVYRWYTPLLHLDVHVKLVQYIKLAVAECGFGSEMTRAPRLPLVGEERERILAVIRHGIESRPDPEKYFATAATALTTSSN